MRTEYPVSAEDALSEVLGPGARLWDAPSIAGRLLDRGYVIRRIVPRESVSHAGSHTTAEQAVTSRLEREDRT